VSPKLKSMLARVTLVGGVALVASLVARNAPHEQTIAVRLGSRAVTHIDAVVTKAGDAEPAVGFSQDFPGGSPRFVRHTFSATNGTYIVVITFKEQPEPNPGGGVPPIPTETSFERQVSLVGGEVIVSPD
jgi:hypothetical protein